MYSEKMNKCLDKVNAAIIALAFIDLIRNRHAMVIMRFERNPGGLNHELANLVTCLVIICFMSIRLQ